MVWEELEENMISFAAGNSVYFWPGLHSETAVVRRLTHFYWLGKKDENGKTKRTYKRIE